MGSLIATTLSKLIKFMYIQQPPQRKNTLRKIQRSQSQLIKTNTTSPDIRRATNYKFRRRSLNVKNVRIDDEKFQTQLGKSPQTVTQLRFLADIIKRKQEPQPPPPPQQKTTLKVEQTEQPKSTLQYQYYDSIVRNLISEIRSRSSKESAPIVPVPITMQNKFHSNENIRVRSPVKVPQPSTIKIAQNKDKMIFSLSLSGNDAVYEKKITSFIQFLYKINFSNCIYVDLSLSRPKFTYRVRVGRGNNGSLVKSLLRRRFWLEIVTSGECHFNWTQLTDENSHENQEATTEKVEHAKYKQGPKKSKLLTSSPDQHLKKILKKEDIIYSNEWYQRSDSGKISCYQKMQTQKVTNHIPLNCIIGAKRILFRLMSWYYQQILQKDPFIFIPKTFSFQGDYTDTLKQFTLFNARDDKIWIVKPGQNTNRGVGIRVMQTKQVLYFLGKERTRQSRPYIVQQYIRPFLYNGRKFDIRHFLLLTSVNGTIRAYWYQEGYLRTCSQKYDIDDLSDEFIHLTNDAVQKRSEKYGKYQPANKISYSQFQRYLDTTYPHKHYNFQKQILEQLKAITIDMVKASFQFMDPMRRGHNFQLYGLDFYVSSRFKPYLIECNANPCLEVNCPILERIVPGAVEHALRLGLDPLLPPPSHYPPAYRYHLCDRVIEKLKYELIFDEKVDGAAVRQQTKKSFPLDLTGLGLKPEQDVFEDDGSELSEDANVD